MFTLPSERVRFGAFELDLSTGELRSIETRDPDNPSPNHKVLLREQVFQVLRMLLEREGKIVTREEIKSRLWANDTVVDFDQGINATIKALRRALGDSADNPRYIETLGRRGYRLKLSIEYLKPSGSPVFKLSIFSSDAEKVSAVLRNRSRNPQPSHLGQQCGPFQSQFDGCAAGSAHDPAGLLKRLHDQSAICVLPVHRR